MTSTLPAVCADENCDRPRRKKSSFCTSCEGKRVDPVKGRASWRAKNHRRRAQRRQTDVTPEYERTLRAKAKRCPMPGCSVGLTDRPGQPNSKELDHIVPLNVGGTHTVGNVRIICRACNQARPKDGGDYTGPVTLWAQAPVVTRAPRVSPRCPHNLPAYKRCYQCQPATPPIQQARGRRAAELASAGLEVDHHRRDSRLHLRR
jgi:hypothetical protein